MNTFLMYTSTDKVGILFKFNRLMFSLYRADKDGILLKDVEVQKVVVDVEGRKKCLHKRANLMKGPLWGFRSITNRINIGMLLSIVLVVK